MVDEKISTGMRTIMQAIIKKIVVLIDQ